LARGRRPSGGHTRLMPPSPTLRAMRPAAIQETTTLWIGRCAPSRIVRWRKLRTRPCRSGVIRGGRRPTVLGHALAGGVGDGVRARARADLAVEVEEVALGGAHAYHERVGDLLVAGAGGEQPENLGLAGREPVRA